MTNLVRPFAQLLPRAVLACAVALTALPGAAQSPAAAPAAPDTLGQTLILRAAERVYTRELTRLSVAKTLNTDAATVNRVRSAADPVIGRAADIRPDSRSWQWSANVETSDVPLLYCLPGGRILVSTGFLNRVRPSPGELSALLAHAIAHALDDHDGDAAATQFAQRRDAAEPDPNRAELNLGDSILKLMLAGPRQPAAEQHADALALELLAKSAQDPRIAPAAWRKVATLTDTRPPAFPALHPVNESRIAAMEALMPAMVAQYEDAKRNQVPAEVEKPTAKARSQRAPRGEGRPIRK